MSSSRFTGQVKFFSKGYGFITDLNTKEDLFVHHTGIQTLDTTFRALVPGEYVEYEKITGKDNKPMAVRVTGIQGGSLMCQQPRPVRQGRPPKTDSATQSTH